MPESFCKKKKLGRCNLQIAPPLSDFVNCTALYDSTLCQSQISRKKNRAVQFTNYTALSDFVDCTTLYYSTRCQSHFARKKNRAVQFTNCTTLSNFVNCTTLYDSTRCQSHFARKKNWGGAIYKLQRPI